MTWDEGVLSELCRHNNVRMLVLFGSRAPHGLPPRTDSDADLALVLEQTAHSPDLSHIRGHFHDAFPGRDLDLVILADADPLFRWEIMNNGVLLFGDADEFAALRALAFRIYTDSADLRRLEHDLFVRRMEYLGSRQNAAHLD